MTTGPELKPFSEILEKALKSVPADASPVFCLLADIWASPQALAPEKRDLLISHLRPLKLRPKTGEFVFSSSGEYINISEGALNLLWCASYASWFIYRAYLDAQKAGAPTVNLGKDREAVIALNLYEWAIACARSSKYEPWPAWAPRPTRSPQTEALHVATEIFLTTTGWMLLHELGHIAHQHPVLVTANAKAEEHEADRFATSHVLEGVSDPAILLKRSIGIALANVILILIDFIVSSPIDSHPDPEERLSRNLRENQLAESNPVHAFATALMQVHLQRFGVNLVLNENQNFASFIDDFCLALRRHRQQ
jgi:hypothetical protein